VLAVVILQDRGQATELRSVRGEGRLGGRRQVLRPGVVVRLSGEAGTQVSSEGRAGNQRHLVMGNADGVVPRPKAPMLLCFHVG
jgi:hypothetical protein